MDYVLQAIEGQWPGQGQVLSRALDRIGVDPVRQAAHSACRLTPSGAPVEFAFCWGDGKPRLTADPAPGESAAVRLERGIALIPAIPSGRLTRALEIVKVWQRDHESNYGAWVGAREKDGEPGFKLYAEVPEAAPWENWEQSEVGAPPVLPSRGVRLCMLGLDPASDTLELYYRLNALYPQEIDALLRRIGLPARSGEITALLESLESRTIRHEIVCSNLGFSYAFLADGARVFTLYASAHSLLGGDGTIRSSILSLLERRSWDGSAYQAVSEPLAGQKGPATSHGMVGCIVAAEGPIRFTAGIAPQASATPADLIREVLGAQGDYGGFRSQVEDVVDENCFVTSLILLELDDLPAEAANRALDFVERCEDPRQRCAFRFYPKGGSSPRLKIPNLDPDADDTALALLALMKYRRRSIADARKALSLIESDAAHFLRGDEPIWVRKGAARTWLIPRADANPVDCCVNANVATLYAVAGLTAEPGFQAACETVGGAVRLTLASPAHLRTVAPFYLHPIELLYAVRRAVERGVFLLTDTLRLLEAQRWAADDHASGWQRRRAVCSNSGGRPMWVAPALQAARQLASQRNLITN